MKQTLLLLCFVKYLIIISIYTYFKIWLLFRPFVKGLEKYEDAAEKGRNGEDCALYYDECQASSLNKLPKFFQ